MMVDMTRTPRAALAACCTVLLLIECISGHYGDPGNHTDYGEKGWCFGGADYFLGNNYASGEACWDGCVARLGSDLVAIDYWAAGFGTSAGKQLCFCQVRQAGRSCINLSQ